MNILFEIMNVLFEITNVLFEITNVLFKIKKVFFSKLWPFYSKLRTVNSKLQTFHSKLQKLNSKLRTFCLKLRKFCSQLRKFCSKLQTFCSNERFDRNYEQYLLFHFEQFQSRVLQFQRFNRNILPVCHICHGSKYSCDKHIIYSEYSTIALFINLNFIIISLTSVFLKSNFSIFPNLFLT